MAAETELERMVVRLVGDGSSYQKMLKEAQAETAVAGKKIGGGIQEAAGHTEKLNLSLRDSRHAIHLLGATTGLEGIARPAMMGVYAYHLLEKGIHAATASLGAFGTLAAGAGIGAVIGGVALAVHWWEETHEAINAANEAAGKMFKEIVTGAKTTKLALEEIASKTLEEGFSKAAEKFVVTSPFAGSNIMTGLKMYFGLSGGKEAEFEKDINKTVEAAEMGQKRLAAIMEHPGFKRMEETAARARLPAEAGKATEEAEKEVKTWGMRKDEALKYKMMLDLINHAGMEESEARDLVNEKFAKYTEYMEKIEQMKVKDTAGGILDSARIIGMAADKAEIYKTQLDYARKNHIDFDKAVIATKYITEAMAEKQEKQEKFKLSQQLLDIENRRKLVFLSKSQAEAEKLILDYLKEHPDRTRAQAKAALGPAIGAFQGEAADKVIKSLQDDIRTAGIELSKIGKSDWEQKVIDKTEAVKESLRGVPLSMEGWFRVNKELADFANKAKDIEKAKLTESLKLPIEKYADRIASLNKLGLSQETYNRAVMAARKELLGVNESLNKFDSAAAGSAEGLYRVLDFNRTIKDNPLDFNVGGVPGQSTTTEGSGIGSKDAVTKIEEGTRVQKDMLDVLKQLAASGVTTFKPAGLN